MTGLEAKVLAARTVGGLVRRAGRGGGTSLPGKVLIRLEPGAIGELARRLPRGSAVLSATNGKTTTAAMVASILEHADVRLVHNRTGANMAGGIASTLLDAARRRGAIDGELGLFEVDEMWLDRIAEAVSPRAVLLANLFRDQLDRYGELEAIADRWASVVARLPAGSRLVLGADDPLIADLGRRYDGPVSYFGVEDPSVALPQMQHAADSKHCRRCGAAYDYDAVYLGHLGVYHCPRCGQRRPAPEVSASSIVLNGVASASFTLLTPEGSRDVRLPLPGLYNVYNALAAAALGRALGASLQQIAAGLEAVTAAFGRAESIAVGDTELSILLIKNPAGANEILRTLALEPGELDLLIVLNDLIADGRDVSWIWDADFELLAGHVRTVVCAGTRAAELALRLKYAGVAAGRLRVAGELPEALDAAVAEACAAGVRRVFALPTYTALLALRDELARRGHAPHWAGAAGRAAR